MTSDGALSGKVALVTGTDGYAGFGRAIAAKLMAEGAGVAFHSHADGVPADGALTLSGDLADADAARSVVEQTIDRFGRLDVLIVAGLTVPGGPLLDTAAGVWDEALRSDLRAAFQSSRIVAERMVGTGNGGSILFLTSHAARSGIAGLGVHSATQFGLVGLMQCMALELADDGIRVNVLALGLPAEADASAPGLDLLKASRAGKGVGVGRTEGEAPAAFPMQGGVRPAEAADMVAFLVSDSAVHVTGQLVDFTGGLVVGR